MTHLLASLAVLLLFAGACAAIALPLLAERARLAAILARGGAPHEAQKLFNGQCELGGRVRPLNRSAASVLRSPPLRAAA